MRNPMLYLLPALIAVGGCAGHADQALEDNCFAFREVRYWEAIDEWHVYIETEQADARFLITTNARCPGLLSSARVDFPAKTEGICAGARMAYLRPGLPRHCRIGDIQRVSALADAKWLIENVSPKGNGAAVSQP